MKNKLLILACSAAVALSAGVCCAAGFFSASAEKEQTASLFTLEGNGEQLGYTLSETYGKEEFQFRLEKGDVLKYNQPIDLSGSTVNDAFLKMRLHATEKYDAPVKRLTMTLTDVYDAENYVVLEGIAYTGGDNNYYSYWKAGAAGQSLVGVQGRGNQPPLIHINDKYGAITRVKFGYVDEVGSIGAYYFDEAKKTFYCNDVKSGDPPVFICDLTEPSYHANAWKGFTTGEVYFSLRLDELQGAHADATISLLSLAGHTFDGTEKVEDTRAPKIVVEQSDFVEKGAVGYPYPIPAAAAYDAFDGEFVPQVKLYKDYGGSGQKEIAAESDRFVPREVGNYTIEYSAADSKGNSAKETLAFSVAHRPDPIESRVVTAGKTEAAVFEKVRLSVVESGGGHGKIVCDTAVVNESGAFYAIKDNAFVPDKAGTYTVRYSYLDEICQKHVYEYNVSVSEDGAYFETDGLLPSFIIKGYKYEIPVAYVYDANGGKYRAEVEIRGAETSGNSFTAAKDAGEVVIVFSAQGKTYEKIISVIDVFAENGNIDFSKYFAADKNASVSVDDKGVNFSFNGQGGVRMLNAFLAMNTEISFSATSKSFTLTFTDGVYEDRVVEAVYSNGVLRVGNRQSTVGALGGDSTLSFDITGKNLIVNEVSVPIDTYTNGEPFGGFSYRKAYFSVSAEEGGFCIKKIGLQDMNTSITEDKIRPEVAVEGDYGGYYEIGSLYELVPAYFYDVLDTGLRCSLTVTLPSGKIAKDVNGKELKDVSVYGTYYFVISEYGAYRVTYRCEGFERDRNFSYVLRAVDTEAPFIKLSSDAETIEAKVGQNVVLPNAGVYDRVDGKLAVEMWLKDPSGAICPFVVVEGGTASPHIKNGKFVPKSKGRFYIVYAAADSAGNAAYKEVCVVVK